MSNINNFLVSNETYQYDYPRICSIAFEIYCRECDRKGLRYSHDYWSLYGGTIFKHPITEEYCIGIRDDNMQDLPNIFTNRLVAKEIVEAAGWFNYPEDMG